MNRQLEVSALRHRMIEGAHNYAVAEKSDPFALKRAMTHLRNGIANVNHGEDAFYKADPYQELRTLPDGREYHVTAYKNLQRP